MALTKVYGSRVVVQSLDLAVPQGCVFGLLGPNGAGKTTTIKMILGLCRPTSGEVALFGRTDHDAGTRAQVGFLPEHFRFHEWMTASEFLTFHADLYGTPGRVRASRIESSLSRVGLAHRAESRLQTFSKGMLQRIGLAQALLNEPKLLVLDEPTSGLDPLGRAEVRDLILELRDQGTTIVLNSHILSEVERVCDQLVIMDLGRIVWSGSPSSSDGVEVVAEVEGVPPWCIEELQRRFSEVTLAGNELRFRAAGRDQIAAAAAAIVQSGGQLFGLETRTESLEQRFISIVQGRDI